jgi:hypothetical protein
MSSPLSIQSPSSRSCGGEWWQKLLLGAQGVVFIPFGSLGACPILPCTSLPWETSKLGFHKISLAQIFRFHSPSLSTSYLHVRTFVFIGFLWNYLQLLYSLVSFETEIRSPKMASQDNLSDFGLVCAAGISGAISPRSLDCLSICSNRSPQHGPQLW